MSCDDNTRTSLVVVIVEKKAETKRPGEELGELDV